MLANIALPAQVFDKIDKQSQNIKHSKQITASFGNLGLCNVLRMGIPKHFQHF